MDNDAQAIAAAFAAIAKQALVISEALGRRDDLNNSVPADWPLALSADEFASECFAMRDHYLELAQRVNQ